MQDRAIEAISIEFLHQKATPTVAAEQDGGQGLSWICFAGSGTVGLVAAQQRRDYTLVELKQEYIEMAQRRIATAETGLTVAEQKQGQMGLFEKDYSNENKI